jgi:hypothetical protein
MTTVAEIHRIVFTLVFTEFRVLFKKLRLLLRINFWGSLPIIEIDPAC